MDNFMDKIAQKLGAQEAIRANAAADAAQMEKLEAQVAQYDACMKEMRKLNLKNVENEEKVKALLDESNRQIKESFEKNNGQLEQLFENSSEQLGQMFSKSSQQLEQLLEMNSARIQRLADECIEKIKSTQTEVWDEAKDAVLEVKDAVAGAKDNESEVQKLLEELKEATVSDKEKIEELFKQSDEYVHKENVKVYRNVQAVVVEELEKQTQALLSSQQQMAGKNKAMFVMNIITMVAVLGNLVMLIAHLAGIF